ncbi:hypothetical protein Scep_028176 [Stephania cephalantha]|uniref:Uncharacterized protein n=1 Tax=Stephania cephalantha TaxID=152367 RepID=A0AAP0EHT1_9MAGN
MYTGNPVMDSSYPHNYGQFDDSHYYNVNGVGLKDLETHFIQFNARLQNMIDEEELCCTQPIFHPEEDANVDTLKIFEVNESEEAALESEEDQPLVLVKPTTLPCTFGKPYKGVEVKERSQIFYTANTLVLDDLDATDSFVLEVPNELPNLKEGVHDSLPECVDAPFVVDISKAEGIT